MSIPNKMTLADLDNDLEELGRQAGLGNDTQVKALTKIAEAAFHGLIDLDPNKHGQGVDDATKRAEKYVKAQTGATVFNAKAPNQAKLISCFRTMSKFGSWTKGGQGEPLQSLNEFVSTWRKLRAQPGMNKRLNDAANSVLKYARTQLKRDQLIDKSEFQDLCMKPITDKATAEEIIETTRKQLKRLMEGKTPGGAQDASPEVKAAIDSLTKRLRGIAISRGVAKMANNGQGNKVAAPSPLAAFGLS